MKKIHRILRLFLFLLFPVATFAQNNYPALLKQFVAGQHDYFNFNGNVIVIKQGKIIYQQALGYADYNSKRMLDDNSVFELASLSKQFTAMGIMILKEKKQLNYSDNVKKFFPDFPYDNITVWNLLTHTSGLPMYETQFEKNWDHKKIAYNNDVLEMLKKINDTLFFKPGTKYKYSNTGYAILAAIIEKVSNMSYNDFMAKNIFQPLGMAHTLIYNSRRSTGNFPPDYALGFTRSTTPGKYILPDSLSKFEYVYYLDGIVGDGGVNSTTGDLFKWDQALYGNNLVSKETLNEMLSPQTKISLADTTRFYGFGVIVQPKTDNGKMISHTGGWPGYATSITRFVDSSETIILLSNNETDPSLLNAGIESILSGDPLLMPYQHKEVKIDPAILDRYAGKYNAFMTMEFIKKDGKFYRHRDGTPDIELKPESDTKFFYGDGTDRQIEFEVDAAGNVTKTWFINTGQKGEMKRLQ